MALESEQRFIREKDENSTRIKQRFSGVINEITLYLINEACNF